MNAIKAITDVLTAMGAQPETIKRPNGETVIKINAPTIGKEEDGKNA